MNLREKLIILSILKEGDWFSMQQVLIKDRTLAKIKNKDLLFQLERNKIKALTILDDDYPELFKEMIMPPFVLYYQGELSFLKENKVSILVGNRPSEYGLKTCRYLMTELIKNKVSVVSEGMSPADLFSNNLTIKNGNYLTFLARGFQQNEILEKALLLDEETRNHLILTEYPFLKSFNWRQYYRSQRLIQELSEVILVIDLSKDDKQIPYLKQLIYDGKPTFILPNQLGSKNTLGGLQLINEGARCLTEISDLWVFFDRKEIK